MIFRIWRELPRQIQPHRFLCGSLALYYGLGSLIAFLRLEPIELQAQLSRNAASQAGLTQALALVLGFVVLLNLVCGLLRNTLSWSSQSLVERLAVAVKGPRFFWFACIVLALQFVLLATGKLGFTGFQLEEGSERISPTAALVRPLSIALMVLSGYGLLQKDYRVLRVAVLVVQGAIIVLMGRRFAVAVIALTMLGFLLARPSRSRIGLALAFAVVAAGCSFPLFFAMRKAQQDEKEQLSLAQRVETGFRVLLTGQTPSGGDFWLQLRENLESRPFIIGYLASLCSRPGHYSGVGGKVLFGALITAVPSVLLPSKDRLKAMGAEEALAYTEFRMYGTVDEATTLITSGYVDAREVGVVFIGIVVVAWLAIARFLWVSCPVPEVAIAIMSATLLGCLFVESGLGALFAGTRDCIILFVGSHIWRLVYGSLMRAIQPTSAVVMPHSSP